MDEALDNLKLHIATCEQFENNLRGKKGVSTPSGYKVTKTKRNKASVSIPTIPVDQLLGECIEVCQQSRKRQQEDNRLPNLLPDAPLSQFTRFTDQIALNPYVQFLHYVPRLVNVVTLAEALPMPGSGLTLPLDLGKIASRCKGSFYAPRRFAAVQLAYSNPRCRVLIFHTGRFVGTGTNGPVAARLAILLAQRQLAEDADVHLNIRNFSVINSVGAVSIKATLNCDAFATEHSGESHYDRSSFVGLAWRPPREHICCEIYSTGKANLPGSVVERQMLESFSRMLPELLRFSSAHHLLRLIPEETQAHHKIAKVAASHSNLNQPVEREYVVANKARQRLIGAAPAPKRAEGLWDGWGDAVDPAGQAMQFSNADDGNDDFDLATLGL